MLNRRVYLSSVSYFRDSGFMTTSVKAFAARGTIKELEKLIKWYNADTHFWGFEKS